MAHGRRHNIVRDRQELSLVKGLAIVITRGWWPPSVVGRFPLAVAFQVASIVFSTRSSARILFGWVNCASDDSNRRNLLLFLEIRPRNPGRISTDIPPAEVSHCIVQLSAMPSRIRRSQVIVTAGGHRFKMVWWGRLRYDNERPSHRRVCELLCQLSGSTGATESGGQFPLGWLDPQACPY